MESKIKTAPKKTTTSVSKERNIQNENSKIKTAKGNGKKDKKEKDWVGSIDTYTTTDTGTQTILFASPAIKRSAKVSAKAGYRIGKGPFKLTAKGVSKLKDSYKERFNEKDNKLKISGICKGPTIKTARPKRKLNLSKFKSTNAAVNKNDTGNTSYDSIQEVRIIKNKAGNTTRAIKNTAIVTKYVVDTIKEIRNNNSESKYSQKIKTGRYIDPYKKRTLQDTNTARKASKTINTGYSKPDINLDRLQGRGAYTGKGKNKGFEKFQSFKTTNAIVQERDTGNTSVEAIQEARIIKTKIENTYTGAKNVYKGIKNIKTASSKASTTGKRIFTKTSKKIHSKVKNARHTARDLKNTVKTAQKGIAATKKSAAVIKKSIEAVVNTVKLAKVLLNPVTIKIGLIVLFVLMLLNVVTALTGAIMNNGGIAYTFIMTEPEIIVSAKEKVDELNAAATQKIQDLLNSTEYDDIQLNGPDEIKVGFQDILAIMGVEDEQEYDLSKVSGIHNDFYNISTRTEIYQEYEKVGSHSHYDSEGNYLYSCDEYDWVDKIRLVIDVEQYHLIQVMDNRGFNEEQQNWGMNLAGCNLLEIYPDLALAGITVPTGTLTPEQISDILASLPTVGATRENIVAIAERLVGSIAYGWGCKADPPAVPTKLDCSGFTDYVYKLAGAGSIGAGTYHQWNNSYSISASDIKIGDLGFLKPPNLASEDSPNHVGIFVGYDSNGNMLFIHCQGGTGTVKTTAQAAGFYYFRRPFVAFSGE